MNKFALMLFAGFLGSVSAAQAAGEGQGMNVVLVLIDDLGQTDLGCYGSKFYETPNLDKLAAESVRFTQAYSACTVCSPTRASLLTGKYPARLHLTDWIPGHGKPKAKLLPPEKWNQELPLEELTLAEGFKKAGYATASIGKWHLGGENFYPTTQGFDLNLGGNHKGQPPSYFSPYGIDTLPDGPPKEFLTDREAVEAGKFMEAHAKGKFFIYLPLHAVHTPLMGKPDVVKKYQSKEDAQGKATYAALVESVDDAVGVLRKKLEELKLWDRTILIFTSDNGGLVLGNTTTNLGMRAGKGSAYEGGVRVPLLVRVPGFTKGGTLCAAPVITPDVTTTLANLALPAGTMPKADGRDLTELLQGEKKFTKSDEAIFWHYPHYHPGGATPYSAVREGDFKLIHFYEDDKDELYNLAADPLEAKDISNADSNKAKALRSKLDAWLKATDAQPPRENKVQEK